MATPQVHVIGKIAAAKNFQYQTVYAKFRFVVGESWKVIGGSDSGDTYQSEGMIGKTIPLEHPFDLNYAASTLRGWPKLCIEVWGIDDDGRNTIAGYGVIGMPMQNGEYTLSIPCWRPRPEFTDTIIGSYPELIYKDVIVSSDSRFPFKTETTGEIIIDVGILTKDFGLHGVQLSPEERQDDS